MRYLKSFLVLLFCTAAVNALQNLSIAEKEPDLDTAHAGRVINNIYVNPALEFSIKPLPGWDMINRGQMNVNEAFNREMLGAKGPAPFYKYRALGMIDGELSRVVVIIVPITRGIMGLATRDQTVKEKMGADLKNAKFSSEPALLGDHAHVFSGFRVQHVYEGHPVYRAFQSVVLKDYLVGFMATADSPQKLTGVWNALKKEIIWKY